MIEEYQEQVDGLFDDLNKYIIHLDLDQDIEKEKQMLLRISHRIHEMFSLVVTLYQVTDNALVLAKQLVEDYKNSLNEEIQKMK